MIASMVSKYDMEVASTLNNYFSNVVKNLKIPKNIVTDTLPQSSRHPTLNAIPPKLGCNKKISQRFSSFYFSHVDKNTLLKEIKKLNLNKALQDSDIPVKIFKTMLISFLNTFISLMQL